MADRRTIRALTILQPWADLIVRGPKRVENRTWAPRGLGVGDYLALHAGKALDGECWRGAVATARAGGLLGSLPVLDGLLAASASGRPKASKTYAQAACAYGAIVGVAKLVAVESTRPDGDPWWFGPVGWRLGDVIALEPVPCSGAQGLWELPPAVLAAVRSQWAAARAARGVGHV